MLPITGIVPHPVTVGAGETTGAVTTLEQAYDKLNRHVVDPVADFGAVADGITNNSTALAAAYAQLVSYGGGVMYLRAGSFAYGSDLIWNSNVVSVIGAGSGVTTLLPTTTAKIKIKPATPTVIQGAKFGGFTVKGNATTNACGVYTGDIIGAEWDDLVVTDFTGTNGKGMWFDNHDLFTERNVFRRVWLNNNTISLHLGHTAAGGGPDGSNSFGYNRWLDLKINVDAGQTGFKTTDDAIVYSSSLAMVCNVANAGTVFDIGDTSQLNRVMFDVGSEQTSGTGGVGRKVASTAFVYGYGHCSFENGLTDSLGGTPRRTPAWRVMQPDGVVAAQDSPHEGVMSSWANRGIAANLHPIAWDNPPDPYATFGFAVGTGVRSPYVTFYEDAHNAFVVARIPFGATSMQTMVDVLRVTPRGELEFPLSEPPTIVVGPALGSSPPAGSASGNNTKGTIALGTGTSTVAGKLASMTFLVPRGATGEVFLQPLSDAAAKLRTFVARSSTGFDIYSLTDVPVASQALGTYVWSFFIAG